MAEHTFSAIVGPEGMPLLGNNLLDWLKHPHKAVPHLHSVVERQFPHVHH